MSWPSHSSNMKIKYQDLFLYYETYGKESKPCVILLHGFMENSRIWNPFIPLLKNQYFLIIPNLFGHGSTPGLSSVHTMEDFAEMIRALLDHLEISSAHFIGHSMGGYITMAMADIHSSYCNSILLMNSIPGSDSEDRQRERDRFTDLVLKDQRRFVNTVVDSFFTPVTREKYREDRDRFIEAGMKMKPENIIAALQGMKIRKDRTKVLKNYPHKKWIIGAAEDALFPIQDVKIMAEETGAQLFILPDGHMSHIEQRERTGEIIREFLSS